MQNFSGSAQLIPAALPDKKSQTPPGLPKTLDDATLLNFMKTSATAKDLKAKLNGKYQTKPALRQRLRATGNKDLKEYFENKFAKDY